MKIWAMKNPRVNGHRLLRFVGSVVCVLIGVVLYQLVRGCERRAEAKPGAGGCGESRRYGEPTLASGEEGNGDCRMAYGPVGTPPLESGPRPAPGLETCSPSDMPASVGLGRGYSVGGCGPAWATRVPSPDQVASGERGGQPPILNEMPAGSKTAFLAPLPTEEVAEHDRASHERVGPGGLDIGEGSGRGAEPNSTNAGSAAGENPADRSPFFNAIRQVESGGDDRAVGDFGRSRGPYQCGRAAWADGGGNPADYDRLVWDRAACERVMVGYWKRYGARTDEERARLWNGGPRWREKPATAGYWRKAQAAMQRSGT